MKTDHVMVFSNANDGNKRISPHFKVSDFACADGSDAVFIHPELVRVLEQVCDHFGKKVTILNAFRSEAQNAEIGGSAQSRHKYGMAADIKVEKVTVLNVCRYLAGSTKMTGIGRMKDHTHIDIRHSVYRFDCRSGEAVAVEKF